MNVNRLFKKTLVWIVGIGLIYIILDYEMIIANFKHREIVLNSSDVNNTFKETSFIFIFNEHNKTVKDRDNKVNKIIYTMNDEVKIKVLDKKRIIYIRSTGAILKTLNDSIDVENFYVKLKGHMGIIDEKNKKFHVDKNSEFKAIEDIRIKNDRRE